jgi:hypothetical protein
MFAGAASKLEVPANKDECPPIIALCLASIGDEIAFGPA